MYRKAVRVEGDVQWLFWCSCDMTRASLVANLSDHVSTLYEDVCKDECLHIAVSRDLIAEISATHGIVPSDQFAGKYTSKWSQA